MLLSCRPADILLALQARPFLTPMSGLPLLAGVTWLSNHGEPHTPPFNLILSTGARAIPCKLSSKLSPYSILQAFQLAPAGVWASKFLSTRISKTRIDTLFVNSTLFRYVLLSNLNLLQRSAQGTDLTSERMLYDNLELPNATGNLKTSDGENPSAWGMDHS